MKRRAFVAAAASFVVAACARAPAIADDARMSAPEGAMPNGLYRVSAYPAASSDPNAVTYDRRLADPDSKEPPTRVALDRGDYVPLVLAEKPRAFAQDDGRLRLEITLAKEHVPTLAAFSRRNVGGRAAVVLGGEIVSVHKQRSVIEDGRMQITRCTDRACERILTKLADG